MVYKWLNIDQFRRGIITNCQFCQGSLGPKASECAGVCKYCLAALPFIKHACFACSLPLTSGSSDRVLCGQCLANPGPQHRSVSCFEYHFPLPEIMYALKFRRELTYTRALSELCAERIRQLYQGDNLPELVIPVPLHPRREFERSFNQSELLLKPITKQLEVKIAPRMVRRLKYTEAQASLKNKDREKNVQGAFEWIDLPKQKHIALFDDVMTTGATLQAMTKGLKGSEVERIDFWSLCRTPKPD